MENREELDWESELWKVVFLDISKKLKNNEPLSASQQNIYDIIKQMIVDRLNYCVEEHFKTIDKEM